MSAVARVLEAPPTRAQMRLLLALVRNGGIAIMSLRHGPIPPGRRMFEVAADETITLAQRPNLFCTLNREAEASLRQAGVSWTRLGFQKNIDGNTL